MTELVQNAKGESEKHRKDVVQITVNRQPYDIHRGRRTVAEIKGLANVPLADELALVLGESDLKPLPDDGSVVIKGGEVFLSYPKDSGSA